MRSLSLLLCVAGLLASAAASAGDRTARPFTPTYSRTIDRVAAGGTLDLDLQTGAGIRIVGWDRDAVRVESDRSEANCPEVEFDFGRSASGVSLASSWPRDRERNVHHCSLGIVLHVPRRFDVRIHSAGGSVAVSNVEGSISGRTGGGQIELEDLRGDVRLETGGGRIWARDSDLDGSISTGGGSVTFENVVGSVTARSGSKPGIVRGRARRS